MTSKQSYTCLVIASAVATVLIFATGRLSIALGVGACSALLAREYIKRREAKKVQR